MTALLNAVKAAGLRRLIVYPNTDRGHSGVLQAIRHHRRRCSNQEVEVVRSLPRDDYLRALLEADLLVGNSSSGIIEAPLAGTPSVDVGRRQSGRQPGGPSVVPAEESEASIRAALRAALRKRPRPLFTGGQAASGTLAASGTPCRSVYGDGRAGERIARILAGLRFTEDLLRKRIRY